jgi:hypothetical protein
VSLPNGRASAGDGVVSGHQHHEAQPGADTNRTAAQAAPQEHRKDEEWHRDRRGRRREHELRYRGEDHEERGRLEPLAQRQRAQARPIGDDAQNGRREHERTDGVADPPRAPARREARRVLRELFRRQCADRRCQRCGHEHHDQRQGDDLDHARECHRAEHALQQHRTEKGLAQVRDGEPDRGRQRLAVQQVGNVVRDDAAHEEQRPSPARRGQKKSQRDAGRRPERAAYGRAEG